MNMSSFVLAGVEIIEVGGILMANTLVTGKGTRLLSVLTKFRKLQQSRVVNCFNLMAIFVRDVSASRSNSEGLKDRFFSRASFI